METMVVYIDLRSLSYRNSTKGQKSICGGSESSFYDKFL